MKKRNVIITLCLLCAAVLLPAAGVSAASAKKNRKALAAYQQLLSQSQIKWSKWTNVPSSQVQFASADINKDGVKELILSYPQASHMDGWHRIYTYTKGKVKSLGRFTSVSIFKNKNYFVDTYANTGTMEVSCYRLGKNGKKASLVKYQRSDTYPAFAKGKVVRKYSDSYGYDVYYSSMKVNGKKASYKKCMKKIRSLEKNAKRLNLNFYDNTAYNVGTYLVK